MMYYLILPFRKLFVFAIRGFALKLGRFVVSGFRGVFCCGRKLMAILLIVVLLQSCTITNKSYERVSLGNRGKIYRDFGNKGEVVKIYLRNMDKYKKEKQYGQSMSVSEYCHSRKDFYIGAKYTIWKWVEINAFNLDKGLGSPISFVCSEQEADFIYEYSYKIKEVQGNKFFTTILPSLSMLIFPETKEYKYEVLMKVKDRKGRILKDFARVDFDHKIYKSLLFIPVQMVYRNGSSNEKVVSEMVLDKVVESLPYLKK